MTTRRQFLKAMGGTAAAIAVGGSAFLGWRATVQGVFRTGEGPAYDAWATWTPRPRSELDLIRAAVLAASAHNTQPWAFRLSPEAIDLYAVPARNIGAMDPLRREMQLSIGCALENLILAARASGRSATVTLLPDAKNPEHAARVALAAGEPEDSTLYQAIPMRHTDRGKYDVTRPFTDTVLRGIDRQVDVSDVGLVWWTSEADRRTFGEITVRATEAIVADPKQAADDYRWYRGDWDELQAHKDGITLDAAGLPPIVRSIAKILPQSEDTYRSGWVRSTRNTHVATAAAFGAIVLRDVSNIARRIQAGRIWQRIHLWAATQGLALQPLNQAVERSEWERAAGLRPEISSALAGLLPERGWSVVMPFRIGYPTMPALASPRRPAEEVILRP